MLADGTVPVTANPVGTESLGAIVQARPLKGQRPPCPDPFCTPETGEVMEKNGRRNGRSNVRLYTSISVISACHYSLGQAGIEPAPAFAEGILSPQRLPFRHWPGLPLLGGRPSRPPLCSHDVWAYV